MVKSKTEQNKKMTGKKGFSLVETLVAVAVVVLALSGAFAAAQSGISSSIFSKDQIIAFYLAAEGVESIRNIRDQNALENTHWLEGIAADSSDPCYFGKTCRVDAVDPVMNPLTTCTSGTCPVLRQDQVNGFYGYTSGWRPTQFTRNISLTQLNENEVSILVRVTWSKGLVNREFRVRENILDWQ